MSANRIALAVIVVVALVSSCKTSENTSRFWQKMLKGKEVVQLSYDIYNSRLVGKKDGTVWITERSDNASPEYFYGFSAHIKTSKKTEVDIGGDKFNLQPGSDTNYQVFKNPTLSLYKEFKTLFGKDVAMSLFIEGKPPLMETFYAPKPVQILSPIPNLTNRASSDVKEDAEIKWVPDPQHKNGIVINLSEIAMPDERTGNMPKGYLLLTPDDGSLLIKDLLRYLPRNGSHFQITLNRFGYKTAKAGRKKYRFFATTSESVAYRLVP